MAWWRRAMRGLRVLMNRRRADAELDEEIRHYFEESEAAGIARGLSPAEANRAARLEVGQVPDVREDVRSSGWEYAVTMLLADLRYAARRLRRSPGFTAIAVVTLSVGIGAATAIFSAVKAVLLDRLPYPEPHRILVISDVTRDGEPLDVTFGTYRELAHRSRSFEALAPFKAWQPSIAGGGEPERLSGQRVGADFFRALGVAPLVGRDFHADEDRAKGPNVTILSHALWQRRFNADPAIVGRTITLDEALYLVVGVMPRTFEHVLAPSTELWAPLQYSTVFGPDSREWGHHLRLVGRLRPDVGVDAARQELEHIAGQPAADFARVPWARLDNGVMATSLQAAVTRAIKPALGAVVGAVILLLAIACVNVTNLLVARGAQRRGEFAVRVALGASRRRLARQLLTETVLLALAGGVLAMIVATVALRTLVALAPPEVPRLDAARLSASIFTVALMLTTLIGAAVGIIPAVQAARENLQAPAQGAARRTTGNYCRTRKLLVVAEVALAVVLLTGAGLLLRSISRVFAEPVGFRPSGLLTMQVQQSLQRYPSDGDRYRFYRRTIDAVRAAPGVSGAACTSLLPLGGDIDVYGVHFETDPGVQDDGAAVRYAVTPEYFEVMGVPLRSGRLLDARDTAETPRAVVISESFSTRRFASRNAIGQRLRFGPAEGDWYTVVGVVGDVKQSPLDLDFANAIYVPAEQWHWVDTRMTLVIRGRGDALPLAASIRQAIWSVDKDVPIVRIATMDALVARAVADRRFALALFEAFGIAALLLVTVGIYGVLSSSVTERFREIGVRAALGASRRAIVGLVLREGLSVVAIGAAVGVAVAVVATRAIAALLFGISPVDPVTYTGVALMVLAASALACMAPAYRAASIDPSLTLRSE